MAALKQTSDGFTFIELLIVLVIIGALTTFVFLTFSGIQQRRRDNKRQYNIGLVDHYIENYFARSSHYPSYTDLSNPKWVAANIKGLSPSILHDPKSNANPIVGAGNATHYGYTVNQGDGTSSCEKDDTLCATFTLTAHLESGGVFVVKSSTQ